MRLFWCRDLDYQTIYVEGRNYGHVYLHPNGTLCGSVAGREVYLGPGNILSHTYAPADPDTREQLLSFPTETVECTVKILTWDISQQWESLIRLILR